MKDVPLFWFVSWCCNKHHQPKATFWRKVLIWLQVITQHRGEPRQELMEESLLVCSLWFAQLPFRHSQGSLPTVDWVLLRQLGQSVLGNSSVNVAFFLVVLGCVKLFPQEAYLWNAVNTRIHSGPAPKILKAQSKCTINTCQMNKWTNAIIQTRGSKNSLPTMKDFMPVFDENCTAVQKHGWIKNHDSSLGEGNPARWVCSESSQLSV